MGPRTPSLLSTYENESLKLFIPGEITRNYLCRNKLIGPIVSNVEGAEVEVVVKNDFRRWE